MEGFIALPLPISPQGRSSAPPIVFSHGKGFKFFEAGQPASDALAKLAEDGQTGALEEDLLASSSVHSVATAAGPILPGNSVTVELKAGGHFRHISAAGMLVSSNDAFFGALNLRLPWGYGRAVYHLAAYDAGSEANNENCDYIPGPPCGNPGVRDTENAEGYVHVHSGIHGVGNLMPEDFDWNNPVVKIHIEAVR